jgi:hypothetical protein
MGTSVSKLQLFQERSRTGMPMIVRDITIAVPAGTDYRAIVRKIYDTDKTCNFIWDVCLWDYYMDKMTFRIKWWFPFQVTKADMAGAMDRIRRSI